MPKLLLATAALVAGLSVSAAEARSSEALVTTSLNVRTGPSAAYQRFGTIPAGDTVTVHGCLSGYDWCDVDWAGGRGWVSGAYLAPIGRAYARQPISTIGIRVGVPVLGFDPDAYHRRHDADEAWYHDRDLDRPARFDGPRRPPRDEDGWRGGPPRGPGEDGWRDGGWRDGPRRVDDRREGWRERRDGWDAGGDRGDERRGGWREGRRGDGWDAPRDPIEGPLD